MATITSLSWFSFLEPPSRNLDLLAFSIATFVIAFSSLAFYYKWWSSSPSRGANQGPKLYPLLGCFPEFFVNMERYFDWTTDYIKKSPGLTMRFGFPYFGTMVYTANPVNVEHILKTKFDIYPKGEQANNALRPLLGDGIVNSDGLLWKKLRKVASLEFSSKALRDLLVTSLQTETTARLLPLLAKSATEGTTIDMQDIFTRFGFDNICSIGFGVDVGCLKISLPNVRFADAFEDAERLSVRGFALPWFLAGPNNRKLKEAVDVVNEFAMSIITTRREEISNPRGEFSHGNSKSDLLSRFIELVNEDTEGRTQKETDSYLRDMLINFVLAGRDTSAATLTFFFWLLSSHPDVEAKILSEVDSIMLCRYSSNPNEVHQREIEQKTAHDRLGEKRFTYDDLKQMHYLHASLTETLRLYPAVPADTKMCLADDVLPDGTVIRRGDRVGYHSFAMGRMECLWGEDCLDFKPERWLKDGNFVQENPYKFAVFQAGPRTCLGKSITMIQMKYVAASIISSGFKLNVLPDYTIKYDVGFTMKMRGGLLCRVFRHCLADS